MRIADEFDVTNITRDSAQVGCTTVTREEVEELLGAMQDAPEETEALNVTVRASEKHPGETVIEVNGYRLLRISAKGVYLHSEAKYTGVAADAKGRPVILETR